MKKTQRGFIAIKVFQLFVGLLILAGIGGWIANIVKVIHSDFGHITGMLVCRVIGIFAAPVGALLGFF